ncbi:hypothetical protein GCM10008995_18820 [Halobellus salinus]|uniref:Uncharacterized protein n=1 Tax=Halobellus salinus TaxID=931585 RepID=A0A830EGB7_9EURY|nr:hypothetical protein GCM10008995_18820 [Halobellus salinus]
MDRLLPPDPSFLSPFVDRLLPPDPSFLSPFVDRLPLGGLDTPRNRSAVTLAVTALFVSFGVLSASGGRRYRRSATRCPGWCRR